MTVKELIKELEKANQNAVVIIVDDCRYEKDLIDEHYILDVCSKEEGWEENE